MLAMGSMPAEPPAAPAVPPGRCEMGETTPERRARIGPSVAPPIIGDCDFTKCAICLEEFAHQGKVSRLECGHLFHAQCWDRVARARVERQLGCAPGEAPCAICRGAGLITA
eukprot:5403949-Pyramimonas_sp.AAC.1